MVRWILVGFLLCWMVAGFFLFGGVTFLGCSREEAPEERVYPITGKIMEISRGHYLLVVLDHGGIPDLGMPARHNEVFDVGDPAILEGKKVGDILECGLEISPRDRYLVARKSC